MSLKKNLVVLLSSLVLAMPFYQNRLEAKEIISEKTNIESKISEEESSLLESPTD